MKLVIGIEDEIGKNPKVKDDIYHNISNFVSSNKFDDISEKIRFDIMQYIWFDVGGNVWDVIRFLGDEK